ncbi:MAG TPA: PAS domain-containing protein, partial [Daejeonella sp.]|nr:PAS domain-containing protein [Daejeonella sp.]
MCVDCWYRPPKIGNDFIDDLALLIAKHGMGGGGGIDPATDVLDVAEGKLTLNQVNLLFRHLPVDISYVDENDIVKFYTDTEERVFPRSKG